MSVRVAILDMNNNTPNRGMGYIKTLVESYESIDEYEIFDIRYKGEIPDLDFDIYLSTGGPGSPWEMDGHWDREYFDLLDRIREHNQTPGVRKKYVFFICHSFQIACIYFKIGEVTLREIMSFGIHPVNKASEGYADPIFSKLPDPFYAADFRYWQVINPDEAHLEREGIEILAWEYEHIHKPDERAIMAIRFTEEMIGTQFHPEADAVGMLSYLTEDERRYKIIEEYGEEGYKDMIEHLYDPNKIALTYNVILPTFLQESIEALHYAGETTLV